MQFKINFTFQAHRLKNADTATTQALASLVTRRRVLLSGTPMQNDLEEFYAMVDFTNPGVLGTPSSFRRTYMHPILTGREPDASDKEKELADSRASELSALVNEFILRRTNALLSAHLPPKLVQIVFCKLTGLQVRVQGSWGYRCVCVFFAPYELTTDKHIQAFSAQQRGQQHPDWRQGCWCSLVHHGAEEVVQSPTPHLGLVSRHHLCPRFRALLSLQFNADNFYRV